MLQPVFLPAYLNPGADDGWRVDHSLYITNTYQNESRGTETLIIDVENYRYELDLALRRDAWVMQASLALLANRSGELDGLIEDWHNTFGLPQGGRSSRTQDLLEIVYTRDGLTRYSQTESSSGLADLSLALGYYPETALGYYIGVELPSGSASDFSGNDAVDWALWMLGETPVDDEMTIYGLVGVSFPGNDGPLKGLLAREIWVAQLGFEYRLGERYHAIGQLDLHTAAVDDSELKAFGNSLQLQLGLGIERLLDDYRLELFFSEDILVGSAPDISFGARLRGEF